MIVSEYPPEMRVPACNDNRRWPNVYRMTEARCYFVNAVRLLDAAQVFDDDLRDAVTALWHDGDDEHEVTFTNVLDAAIDEQDRRRHTPLRPRQPMPGARVRIDE